MLFSKMELRVAIFFVIYVVLVNIIIYYEEKKQIIQKQAIKWHTT